MMDRTDIPLLEDIFILDSDNFAETEIVRQCFNIVGVFVAAIDLDGKITLINRKGQEILEFDEEEIKGKDWVSEFIDENKKEETKNLFLKVFKGECDIPENYRYSIISKSGQRKIIEAKQVIIRNKDSEIAGLLISGEEVTGYLQIQKELQYSINLYRILASNIPDINMYLFDQELRYIIAEGSEMKNHSLSYEYFEGKRLYDILDEEIRSILVPLYQAALNGKEISTEYTYKDYDYLIWVFPLKNDENQVYAGMAITQNITKEKQIAGRLKKAKDQAVEANRTKSEFLANVSHEIRTPLNAIVGFTEQLLKTQINEKQEDFLRIIDNASEHLLALVNEILVLSKIEAGEIRFDNVPFKVEHVVKDIYSTLQIKADEKKINFKYDIDPQLDMVLIGDHFRLRQILMNMISNAIKFTDSGYVEIKCFRKKEADNKVYVRFDIIDTGIGISEDKLETIFDQFKQADSTVTKRFGGTGLGLTISKKLTELQHGSISVNSKPDVGTQFTVVLPYEKGNEKDFLLSGQANSLDADMLHDTSVLLVDDDGVNRLLGKTILEELGSKTDVAMSGGEAIAKLKTNRYDIILLDIHMPEISGIDVAHFIRRELNDTSTKIIAVTAAVMKEDIEQYYKAGINDYLIKPYKEINLYNKVCKVLKKNIAPVKLSREEIILKEETQVALYNLYELKRIAKDNNEFFIQMLNTFIKNTTENIEKLEKYLTEKNWVQIGETAHKMLPSFRHLEIRPVISDLMEVKEKTLINPQPEDIPPLVEHIIDLAQQVISKLEMEKGIPQD